MEASGQDPVIVPERAPFKRRGHIVVTLFVVLLVVGLVPLATGAWKLIDINREALTTAQQETQLLLASSTARQLDTQVEAVRGELQRTASALGSRIRRRSTLDAAQIARELADADDLRILHLRYSFFQGDDVRSVAGVGEVPAMLDPWFENALRDAAAALASVEDREATPALVAEPLLLPTEPPRAALIVSAPVVSRGAFRGVLTALVDLETLWDEVTQRNRTGHVIFAVDQKGTAFATSNPQRFQLAADVSDSPLVRRYLGSSGRTRQTMPFMLRHGDGTERYIGSYDLTRHGWGIFVQARQPDVYGPVSAMIRSTLTWMLGALLLAGLAAIVSARSLSTPINRLAAASRAFARGDFSTRVAVGSTNEIGELAHTFNMMAADIESYIRKLKRALAENNQLFLGTIRALAEAIDAKDPYTRGHSMRVNRYSVILAQELGLPEDAIRDIHVSSLLHDVGKIGIDDAILKKPGALTDPEFEVMKTHPVLGANIMAPIPQMQKILPGLRHHHERWHGSGYPDGLRGEQIPLMARIIAVADTWDAITTNRPYQSRMTPEQALARLNELKGVALDAPIVEAFNRLYQAGQIRVEGTAEAAEVVAEPAPELVPGRR